MVYRQNLQQYERSDPQGYNNWGSSNSTPNNQALQRRTYQTPPKNRPPLSSSSGRQGAIYNSFLANYDQPSVEQSRLDPPPSIERNRKVNFSAQLEVHEKQKTPVHATPATPILRSGARARTNLAPTPSGERQSPQQFSGRDPTPRAEHGAMISAHPEKRKTIHDILSERTNTELVAHKPRPAPGSDPALNRSRRPRFSASLSSPRDIFSKMALRATQSEIKAPKKAMEPEATQTLLRQARLSHGSGKSRQSSWDISELFPSTPQDGKKQSHKHPTPLSIEELLSQPPPPPPPLPKDTQKSLSHLKAYESRGDHWDAADLYSDSWNRHLQGNSPGNASTESQNAYLINRYQPKSSDGDPPSPDSTASEIQTYHLRQEEIQTRSREEEPKFINANASTKVIFKAHRGCAQPYGGCADEEDDHDGTEVVLLPGPERAEGIGRGQQRGSETAEKDHGRKTKAVEGGKRLDLGTLLKLGTPRQHKTQPPIVAFQHFPAAGISFEESPELNKKDTIDTSETNSADEINVRRNLSRDLDRESTESWESHDGSFRFSPSRGRFKRKWKLAWVILCLVMVGLVIGLPLYYLVFVGAEGHSIGATTALKFDGCVVRFPDPALYSSRYTNMRKIVIGTVDGEAERVDEPGSPQRKALCWISDFDVQIDSIGGAEVPAIVQRYTMAVLYYALVQNGETSEKSLSATDYLSSSHECEWSVVMCASPNTVTSLLLADKLLTGPLPAEIGNLVNLSFLDFSLNPLSGNIPSTIEKLTHLEYLALAFTSFSGTIPSEIGMLSKLEILNMRSSQVHGTIPTELGGLSQLETLLLDGNWLSGTIPEHLGNLGQAQQMSLGKNYLTGRVPGGLCELRDISLVGLEVDSWIECECCTT